MEENIKSENESDVIVDVKNKSYITGTIGAIIGGTIAAIPWILSYCFANLIVAVLSILIGFGAFQGYKLFKGKIGKHLPLIIAVVSVLVIIISTIVVCPIIMMVKEEINVTLSNLQLIYKSKEFVSAIMKDLLVSLIFTIIGIAASLKSISIQIKEGTENVKFNEQALNDKSYKQSKEKAEIVKKAFETLNAFEKNNAVAKQEVINELELNQNIDSKKAKQYFNLIVSLGIVKKHKGKFYYNTTDEEQNLHRVVNIDYNKKITLIVIISLFAIFIIGQIILENVYKDDNSENGISNNSSIMSKYEYTIPNTDLTLNINSQMYFYKTQEEITEVFGENLGNYYNFVVITKDNQMEIYGLIIDKNDLDTQYTFDEIVEADRENTAIYYDNVTDLVDEKIGNINFKKYGYKDETNNYTSYIYIAEIGDKYIYIDTYCDIGKEDTLSSTMKKLIK